MVLLHSVGLKLLELVKVQFEKDIKERNLTVPQGHWFGSNSFWRIEHNDELLFRQLITDQCEPTYLRDTTALAKSKRRLRELHGKSVVKINRENYILPFLIYLNFDGDTFSEKFMALLEKVSQEEKDFQLKNMHTNIKENSPKRREEQEEPRIDIDELIENQAKYLSQRYTHRLLGESFWFFFYGYDKFKGVGSNRDTWPLVKLLFEFTEMVGIDMQVEIENTGDPEHHHYSGKTDFLTSREEVLVINCRTYPDISRQLNIKINVGKGDGNIFLGQYLNYESEGRIISGSVLMQRIIDESDDFVPKVHRVPILKDGKVYEEEFDGIHPSILQYLHDKKLNFRRTSLRAGHSIGQLEKWLKHHRETNN